MVIAYGDIVHKYPVDAFQTRQTLMKLGDIYGKFLLILSHGHEHRVGCYIVLTDPVAAFQTRLTCMKLGEFFL